MKKGETYIDFVTLYDFGPWAMFGLFYELLFHPAHRNGLILAARGRGLRYVTFLETTSRKHALNQILGDDLDTRDNLELLLARLFRGWGVMGNARPFLRRVECGPWLVMQGDLQNGFS